VVTESVNGLRSAQGSDVKLTIQYLQNGCDVVSTYFNVVRSGLTDLYLRIWHKYTTERHQSSNEQRIDKGSERCVRRGCRHELADTSVDELINQHDEEDCAGLVGRYREAGGVVLCLSAFMPMKCA
jgi:hypothetical protein